MPYFGALTAPIRQGQRVLACVNIVFSKRATALSKAIKNYSADLLAATREIESRLVPRPAA